MNFKKEKFFLGICLLAVLLFFLTRFFNITIIPVFADEAIYIRWAQVMRAVSSLRFLPLSDGKQPLFMWLIIPFLKVFADPLVAGRAVSVLAGLGTMVGIFVLSLRLFKDKNIALFSSLLYLITPFALFFDRLALADGLLSFFGIWFLIFVTELAKKARLDWAMISGIILGLGLLTKSPAMIFGGMLPLSLILFPFKEKDVAKNLGKIFAVWAVVFVFGFVIYNILRLGSEFHMIGLRNKDYVFTVSEIIKHPFNPLVGNLKSVLSWNYILLTPFVFLAGIGGIFLSLKKRFRPSVFLLLWWVVPLLAQSAVAKVYTARYILFTVPVFLIFCGYFLSYAFLNLKNKYLPTLFLIIVFLLPVYQSLLLLILPQKAWLPRGERSGYLELWTAGYGIKEAADYLKSAAVDNKVLVGTEGYFGTLPDGLQIYLEKAPNTTVVGVGYPISEIPQKLTDGLGDSRVFLLVNDSRFRIESKEGLKLISSYPKATQLSGVQENLLFFELTGKE